MPLSHLNQGTGKVVKIVVSKGVFQKGLRRANCYPLDSVEVQ